jgi:ATP-dependent Lhr-like helicase
MRVILDGNEQFGYLDPVAQRMLTQARDAYAELRLDERATLRDGEDTLVLPWTGDRELGTLGQLLASEGADVATENIALRVADTTEAKTLAALQAIAGREPPSEIDLARKVQNKIVAKYDDWLGEELLSAEYATTHLDCVVAVAVARELIRR